MQLQKGQHSKLRWAAAAATCSAMPTQKQTSARA
jgi:hypothetical protein